MLRKLFAIIVPFLLLAKPVCAQFKPLELGPSYKKWEDGPLSLSDFKGKPLAVAPMGSEFLYSIFYKAEKEKIGDSTVLILGVTAFMDREQSWIHDSVKTDLTLKFNQAIFNYLEFHERILQQKLMSIQHINEAPNLAQQELRAFRELMARYQVETNKGWKEKEVNSWLHRSYQQLDSVEKIKLPAFRISNFGMGLHYSLNHSSLGGDLNKIFSNALGFGFGFDFSFKNAVVFLNPNVGYGKLEKAYTGVYDWPDGLNYGLVQVGAGFGVTVLDNAKWRITPFAGPAFVSFSVDDKANPERYDKQYLTDNTYNLGVNIDWKLRHQLSFIPSLFGREKSDYGIRTRFIMYPVQYAGNLNGSVYNLSFAFYLNGRFIKLKT
ncbi:hypothetical protein [Adhaeribacter terreus]|uniref:Uncharacterized protein n=1 Tax=Adhaeribacter terreus TaxID=529703 RepID=A0ABW0E4T1_9BACT